MKIGIIGAGMQGRAVAKFFIDNGHEVWVCNSRKPETLQSLCIRIGCKSGTLKEVIAESEIIVLSIPFFAVFQLHQHLLDGKIVIDTVNYYPERDGNYKDLDERKTTTSTLLSEHFKGAHWVKTLNAILAIDLEEMGSSLPNGNRRAMPVAGNELESKNKVINLLQSCGFDVLDAGRLENSWRFERAKPAYCIPLNSKDLNEALAQAEWDKELPHGSWRRELPFSSENQSNENKENKSNIKNTPMNYYIVTYTHPDEIGWKKHLQAHVDYLIDLVNKGKIHSSGPFLETSIRSAAILFQATSKEEVEQLVALDPYTIHGQVGECTIREWKPLFGILADGANEVPKELIGD